MMFDRDSFMAGVLTGMKLGRYPGIAPQPPVSPSTFIITENGRYMIDEQYNQEISFVGGSSPPITTIDYRINRAWIVYAEDIPISAGLGVGDYTIEDTGAEFHFHKSDNLLNYYISFTNVPEGIYPPQVNWSASYTDPDPAYLYFFYNSVVNEYAILLYKDGDASTYQLPLYLSADTFDALFFYGSGSNTHRMITEKRGR